MYVRSVKRGANYKVLKWYVAGLWWQQLSHCWNSRPPHLQQAKGCVALEPCLFCHAAQHRPPTPTLTPALRNARGQRSPSLSLLDKLLVSLTQHPIILRNLLFFVAFLEVLINKIYEFRPSSVFRLPGNKKYFPCKVYSVVCFNKYKIPKEALCVQLQNKWTCLNALCKNQLYKLYFKIIQSHNYLRKTSMFSVIHGLYLT